MFSGQVTDHYLYHYTTLETAIEKILYQGKLRLGLFEQTNDPRESQEWGINTVASNVTNDETNHLLRLVNQNRLKMCKVVCFTKDDLQNRRSGMGRRGFARARMWAQYADKHRGACLIFDAAKLDASIRQTLTPKGKIYQGMVDYTDSMEGVAAVSSFNFAVLSQTEIREIIRQHIDHFARTLFFRKNRDWEDETEYRYVLYSDQCEPEFVPVAASLQGMVLGVDFPEVYYPVIAYFRERYALNVGCIRWSNGIPYICKFEECFDVKPFENPDYV